MFTIQPYTYIITPAARIMTLVYFLLNRKQEVLVDIYGWPKYLLIF